MKHPEYLPQYDSRSEELYKCPDDKCGSEFVELVPDSKTAVFADTADIHWHAQCRCVTCGWLGERVYDDDEITNLQERAQKGIESIRSDLWNMKRADMENYVECFIGALQAEAILPEDF